MSKLTDAKLRMAIGQFRLRWGDKRTRVPASVGVVQISLSMNTPEHVLGAAASACREAKEAGRNCVRVYRASEPVAVA